MLEKSKDALSGMSGTVPLKDKVVLLLNGTNQGGRTLALSLARNGADLAIVYRRGHAGQAQEMLSAVKIEGRRCLIIESESNGAAFSRKAINQTLTGLGRLDIFIDYSSLSPDLLEPGSVNEGAVDERGQRKQGPFNNGEMVSAVLNQLATRDLGSRQRDKSKKELRRRNRKRQMRLASELVNKPVITVKEGQEIGKVQDFYLDQRLTQLVAIYLDSGGFLSSQENVISWSDVVTVGQDAILVKAADSVTDIDGAEGITTYIRRDEIDGRQINTPGGTKIGSVGDVVLDNDAHIIGLSLTKTQVSGPIAANKAISRTAIVDFGHENGVMTVDLAEAEKADLQVVYDGLFGEPSVSLSES